jgi:hypothetical protein
MIERDDHIPPLAELVAELAQARTLAQRTLGGSALRTPAPAVPAAARAPAPVQRGAA